MGIDSLRCDGMQHHNDSQMSYKSGFHPEIFIKGGSVCGTYVILKLCALLYTTMLHRT